MIVLLVYGTINTLFMIYNNYEYKMALLTTSGNIYLINYKQFNRTEGLWNQDQPNITTTRCVDRKGHNRWLTKA